mgnify:CR=1 FL=1
MIRRVSDNQTFPNEQLEKLAEAVSKKENTHLFDVVDKDKVDIITKQLKIKGFDVKLELIGDKVKIYAIVPDKVKFQEAIDSGSFKKLAWGRYCFQRESALGMFKYDFDEGSIWKVIADPQTGEEYLVKEVSDENEDDIVRIKTASDTKQQFVNDETVHTIMSMLYDDVSNDLLKDIKASTDIKSGFYNMLNTKFEETIERIVVENHFINSPNHTAELKGVIKTAIDNKQLKSRINLDKLISEYSSQIVAKTGKMNKLF